MMLSIFEVLALLGSLIALGAIIMTVSNLRRLPIPEVAVDSDCTPEFRLCVCIPARNEAANIEACVRSVLASGPSSVRVLIYNDQSKDDTGAIVDRMAAADPRIMSVPTQRMPAGWCGKQHACWQLGQYAMTLDDASCPPNAL